MTRLGLEAGPLSQWLFAAMEKAGLPVPLLETRHVRSAFKAMTIKTDRKDALGIARLMRMGWLRAVHRKSLAAQAVRALLTELSASFCWENAWTSHPACAACCGDLA